MTDQAVVAPPDRLAATLLDLRLHAAQVAELLHGVTRESFLADERLRAATMFNLIRFAEAVRDVPSEARAHDADVDWGALSRFTAERSYGMTEDDRLAAP